MPHHHHHPRRPHPQAHAEFYPYYQAYAFYRPRRRVFILGFGLGAFVSYAIMKNREQHGIVAGTPHPYSRMVYDENGRPSTTGVAGGCHPADRWGWNWRQGVRERPANPSTQAPGLDGDRVRGLVRQVDEFSEAALDSTIENLQSLKHRMNEHRARFHQQQQQQQQPTQQAPRVEKESERLV